MVNVPTTPAPDEPGLRKAPQQQRSQQRVDAILEAAAGMIAAVGYEGVTTSRLAHQVGISIGSFYQYFANKEAVFQALGERYLDVTRQQMEAMFPADAHYAPVAVLVGRAVDLLALQSASHRQLNELMDSGWVSPELRAVSTALGAEIVAKIAAILAHKAPGLGASECETAALVMMYLVKGVMPASAGQPEPVRSAIIEEFKRAGVTYMESVIMRASAA